MKRILPAVLSIVMLFSAIMPASAIEASLSDYSDQLTIDINAEIERAINGETDLELDASDIASATLFYADGTAEDVDVFVTTRKLQVGRSGNEDAPTYATTVVAQAAVKDEFGHNEREYVTGTMTLYWTDNFGMMNAFEGLSGGWSVVKNPDTGKIPSLSERKVKLMGGSPPSMVDEPFDEAIIYPNGNTFSIPKGGQVRDGWLYYQAWSWVRINGGNRLEVKVATHIYS